MKITAIKTSPIVQSEQSLWDILDKFIVHLPERSILAITSKIVGICEGNVIKIGEIDKQELIEQEAEYYLGADQSKYNVNLTIKHNILSANAGIDESNSNGYYSLWPKDPQLSANQAREYLVKRFSLKEVGVVITDSKATPLRWGTTGVALSYSGFEPLNNYIGKPDIFGKPLKMTKANVADALAAAAVLIMGEGDEQTPLAIIEYLPFVHFQNRNPSEEELKDLHIDIEDDMFAKVLTSTPWRRRFK